jgi:hypothetical protein
MPIVVISSLARKNKDTSPCPEIMLTVGTGIPFCNIAQLTGGHKMRLTV